MTTYCLDQGYFRSADFAVLVKSSTDLTFVVTDAAFMEMCKSSQWEQTIRGSLKHLASIPRQVLFAKGHGECFRMEIETKRAIGINQIICPEQTAWFSTLLVEVAQEKFGACFQAIADQISDAHVDLQHTSLNHDKNLDDIRELICMIDTNLTSYYKRRLRANAVPRDEFLSLISTITPQALSTFSEQAAFSPAQLKAILDAKSFIVRYTWLRVKACMDWIAHGGIDTVGPQKITNSDVDREYLVVGSYCDALLSCDGAMRQLDADLRYMLVANSPPSSALT